MVILPSLISINFSDLKSDKVLIKLSVAVPAILAKSSLEIAIEKCSFFSESYFFFKVNKASAKNLSTFEFLGA